MPVCLLIVFVGMAFSKAIYNSVSVREHTLTLWALWALWGANAILKN